MFVENDFVLIESCFGSKSYFTPYLLGDFRQKTVESKSKDIFCINKRKESKTLGKKINTFLIWKISMSIIGYLYIFLFIYQLRKR
jgi:hypothetical protein